MHLHPATDFPARNRMIATGGTTPDRPGPLDRPGGPSPDPAATRLDITGPKMTTASEVAAPTEVVPTLPAALAKPPGAVPGKLPTTKSRTVTETAEQARERRAMLRTPAADPVEQAIGLYERERAATEAMLRPRSPQTAAEREIERKYRHQARMDLFDEIRSAGRVVIVWIIVVILITLGAAGTMISFGWMNAPAW